MSANLDTNAAGEAAVVYAADRVTPWHKQGTPISDADARDLDLAIEKGGIGFGVEKVPHFVFVPAREGARGAINLPDLGGWVRPVKSDDGYSVVRTDRDTVIGTVGSTYTVLPNADAWAPIRPVLEEGLANIETAGSLRGGRQVWMMLRFDTNAIISAIEAKVGADKTVTKVTPEQVEAVKSMFFDERGDAFLPYGLLTADHTGKAKARIKETGVVVVCQNTLDWSLGANEGGIAVEVPHVRTVREDWRKATTELFGNLTDRFLALANYRRLMRSVTLGETSFVDLVLEACYPVKHLESKIQRREASAFTVTSMEKSVEKRERIRGLWEGGVGHTGDRSVWEAYQAAVEFVDHDTDALPSNNDRVQSLMDGVLKKAKGQVFRGLMNYSVNADQGKEVVADLLSSQSRAVVEDLLVGRAN